MHYDSPLSSLWKVSSLELIFPLFSYRWQCHILMEKTKEWPSLKLKKSVFFHVTAPFFMWQHLIPTVRFLLGCGLTTLSCGPWLNTVCLGKIHTWGEMRMPWIIMFHKEIPNHVISSFIKVLHKIVMKLSGKLLVWRENFLSEMFSFKISSSLHKRSCLLANEMFLRAGADTSQEIGGCFPERFTQEMLGKGW